MLLISQTLTSLLIIASAFSYSCGIFDRKSFDAVAWRVNGQRERGRMVRDLKVSKIINDKTRVEVIEMLGTPDSETEQTVTYLVDVGHKFGSNPWLYNFSVIFDTTTNRVQGSILDD